MSGPEGAIIAINAEANWRASRHAVQKVYGHLLLKNLEMNTPPWFDQGLARLFASFEIGRDQMMLGRARADEVGFFQLARKRNWDWLAWDEFFGKNYSGSRQFDSQAWLLLHYCFLSSERAQSWRVGILQLAFEAQMGNSDYPALLQRYLGVDFAGLQEELERYARKVNFPAVDLPLPENFKRGKLDYSNLAPEVLTEVLWELKVRSGRHEGLAELLAQGINETQRARRWELFGLLAFVQNDADTAFERWDRAIELGSSNGFIHRARAEAGLAGVLKIGPSSHPLNPAKVDEWRASLLRSLEAEPEDLRAIQWLACLEALAPEPDVANVNRVQRAVGELPRPYLTYLAVAWIRYQLGDRQTAASIVASLKPWTNWEYAQWVSALEFELETASTE
jgi:hypothetical protein